MAIARLLACALSTSFDAKVRVTNPHAPCPTMIRAKREKALSLLEILERIANLAKPPFPTLLLWTARRTGQCLGTS